MIEDILLAIACFGILLMIYGMALECQRIINNNKKFLTK